MRQDLTLQNTPCAVRTNGRFQVHPARWRYPDFVNIPNFWLHFQQIPSSTHMAQRLIRSEKLRLSVLAWDLECRLAKTFHRQIGKATATSGRAISPGNQSCSCRICEIGICHRLIQPVCHCFLNAEFSVVRWTPPNRSHRSPFSMSMLRMTSLVVTCRRLSRNNSDELPSHKLACAESKRRIFRGKQ